MGNQSNCSVVFTLFKVTFLGKWDECGERPFLWSLTSFPDRHTYSVHSVQSFCPPALNSSAGTSSGPVFCDLLSDGSLEQPLNEVVEALSLNILVHFHSLPHRGTSLSTCLRFVQLQSNYRQLLTGYNCRRDRNFRVLPIFSNFYRRDAS